MNHLVAANKKPPLPLAQKLPKILAAVFAAALSFAGSASAAGTNSVSLAWDPNPETDLAGYRLQYGLTPGSYPNVIDAGKTTSATATGLNQGTTYYFTVVAYNTAGQTGTASSEVSYTVPGTPNTAPAASDFSLTVAEDGQATATLSGTDGEGDLLTYSIVSAPTKGTLTGTAPNLTYKPAANATGSDSFTYRANDGALNSANATVSITITPVNDLPVASAKSATVAEDGQVAITLSGSDVDGDVLTYEIVTAPTKGTLSGTAPNLTYKPAANLNGSDSFTYRVNDGTANSAAATVSITISAVNDVPVADAQTLSVAEDTPLTIKLTGSDVENSSLTYSIVTQPTGGTLSGTAPNLTYTPKANFNGADSFAFKVNDGSANSAAAWISLTVTPVNDAPVATPITLGTAPNTALAVTLAGTDVEGSPLTYEVVTSPVNGTLSGTAPALTYTPNLNYTGSDSFTYRVNDGTINSATATVSITIAAGNIAPVANSQSLTVEEDSTLSIKLTGSDPEAKPITYFVITQPTGGTLSGTVPNLTYTPAANFSGADSFAFRVNDGNSNSPAAWISITVTPVNDAPVATARTISTTPGVAVGVTLAGTDVEGSALTYVIVNAPANGTLSGTAPNLTYTPNTNFSGNDNFTYRVNDGTLNSANATVAISVGVSNRVPQAHTKSATTMKGKAVKVTLSGTDPDADTLSYRIVSAPEDGTLTGTPPNVTYTPVAKWTGNDKFTYVVNDGKADSPVATVNVKVKDANQKPTATSRSVAVNQNTTVTISVSGTDADGDSLTYAMAAAPKFGTIVGNGVDFRYTPNTGFKGKDKFTFVANDGTINSAVATVEINVVNPNNKAPSALSQNLGAPAKKAVAIFLQGTDPDSDPLTFRVVTPPANGTITGKGANLKFKPVATFSGTVSFTYVANDGSLDSAPATVTITIAPPAPAVRSIAAKSKAAAVGEAGPVPGLVVNSTPTGGMILTVTGVPGQRYALEHSENLTGWSNLQEVDIPETGAVDLEMTVPPGAVRVFFRLQTPD
ncbi:Ig-like domain-containing protein [Luteolibacter soli]|uniref:Ig-like domain-containing protein n=1 Tax=Luteolibacter soli TaxID=3135280 RepID=A0ABU9ASB0_9BACT